MKTNWIRVSRRHGCLICGKHDWCLIAPDGTAAICQRVESDKPVGNKGAGWWHRLSGASLPPIRLPIPTSTKAKPDIDWDGRHTRYVSQLTDAGRLYLADELGVSVAAIAKQLVGWCSSRSCWTWPMRDAGGRVVGIRTRYADGKKRADTGSDGNGLFVGPDLTEEYLLICEGPTDTAALIDCGYLSVLGRPSCRGGNQYIIDILKRIQPKSILLIPDRDKAGMNGFADLAANFADSGIIPLHRIDAVLPPADAPDARAWAQKNRKDLTKTIAEKLENIKARSGGSNHDAS